MKKIIAVLLALAVTAGGAFASADSAVDAIINAGTTQAFSDESVPEADLNLILQAGLASESAINQQPWFFAAVTNREVMEEIASAGPGFGGFPSGGPGGFSAGGPGGFPGGAPDGFPSGGPGGGQTPPAAPGGSGPKAALGDSPAAIIIYKDGGTASPDASFDCGLAAQNMYIAAVSLGYGAKIISSPTMALNGENHDDLCAKLGVDPSMTAVAVLLIGRADASADAATGATTRSGLSEKVSFVK